MFENINVTPYDETRKAVTLEEYLADDDAGPMMVSISFPLWDGVSFEEVGRFIHDIGHALTKASHETETRVLMAHEEHATMLAVGGHPMPMLIGGSHPTEKEQTIIEGLFQAWAALGEAKRDAPDLKPEDAQSAGGAS